MQAKPVRRPVSLREIKLQPTDDKQKTPALNLFLKKHFKSDDYTMDNLHEDDDAIEQLLKYAAKGMIQKSSPDEEIMKAITICYMLRKLSLQKALFLAASNKKAVLVSWLLEMHQQNGLDLTSYSVSTNHSSFAGEGFEKDEFFSPCLIFLFNHKGNTDSILKKFISYYPSRIAQDLHTLRIMLQYDYDDSSESYFLQYKTPYTEQTVISAYTALLVHATKEVIVGMEFSEKDKNYLTDYYNRKISMTRDLEELRLWKEEILDNPVLNYRRYLFYDTVKAKFFNNGVLEMPKSMRLLLKSIETREEILPKKQEAKSSSVSKSASAS